ncbi:hypothetical protein B0181_06475 [Moraxella caviae]|uniref:MarR family n=1 Tax=Moraxella caviae TaxID=34060 RepID=A0A1T0A230_9GAMM|nr:MarR family winged helix-turn-helix transcriptional regulator [Moraxella caviae]OOR89609.1 hypothetical protein B0181_06475 [Moraxella caviae]STZ10295.1 MarR family [Moraxella caviae]
MTSANTQGGDNAKNHDCGDDDKIGEMMASVSRIESLYGELAKKLDITYPQMAIYHSLTIMQACNQQKICQQWLLPKQTVHNYCKEFVAQGLISEQTDAQDKRKKIIILTKKGETIAVPIAQKVAQLERQIISKMGDDTVVMWLKITKMYEQNFAQILADFDG